MDDNTIAFVHLSSDNYEADVMEKVMHLKNAGIGVRKIAELLQDENISIGKTKLAEMINAQLKLTIEQDSKNSDDMDEGFEVSGQE